MTRSDSVKYEMFLRVDDFGETHTARFPASSAGAEVFATLRAAIAQIEAQGTARGHAERESRHGGPERAALRQWMVDLARTSRAVARTADAFVPLRMPGGGRDATLLEHARQFLEVTAPLSDQFVTLGLAPDWTDRFKAAIAALEARRRGRRSSREGRATASVQHRRAMADAMAAVQLLDVIVANALKGDGLLPVWERVRHVSVRRGRRDEALAVAAEPVSDPAPGPTITPDLPADAPLKQAS